MMANRVEFVVAVHAISKLGAAAVLLSPAWKAVEVGHAVELTGPVHAVADGEATAILGERLGADHVTDLDDQAALDAAPRRRPHPAAGRRGARHRRVRARVQLGHDRPARRRCATRTLDGPRHARTGCEALGLGPDDRFQVATPPSHILGLLNLLAAAAAGATVRLHRRFDLDEVLRRDRDAIA